VSTTGFGFLTFDWVAPPVSDTSMESDFLHSFDVLSKFVIQVVTGHLAVFAVFPVSLSVQEPSWDFEVLWVSHNSLDLFHFGFRQLTGSFGSVDFGFFQDQVGESSAHTSDGGQSVGDFDVTVDVGVLHSQNMLQVELTEAKNEGKMAKEANAPIEAKATKDASTIQVIYWSRFQCIINNSRFLISSLG